VIASARLTDVSLESDIAPGRAVPARVRWPVFVLGIALIWFGVVLAESRTPADLTVVLLLLLALVLCLALLTGPVLGIATALIAVGLVNWYLVPPTHTLTVANADNVVALVVFAFVAGVGALLVELNGSIRSRAVRTQERAGVLSDVVATDGGADPSIALERVRLALDLDRATLSRDDGAASVVLVTAGSGTESGDDPPVLDIAVAGGYRLVGSGPPRIAEDPAYVASLAAATVRAYESSRMESERMRAEELAAVDTARTALLASVGHDLRTPLAGLRLAVDALRAPDSQLDDTTTAELLETVDESTARLDELITNLLDMSRLEAGVLLAQVHATPVDAAVAAAVLTWPHAAVDTDVSDSLPLVLADPALLERVVENLVSNAVRHAAPTREHPVLVVARNLGDVVQLDVVDRGPGLPAPGGAPASARPMSPGGRADGSTGLGLAIVRGFCGAMSVPVEFLRTEGGGLTARLLLPVASPS
jgi:two-component system sensor histidine kinase KdpD